MFRKIAILFYTFLFAFLQLGMTVEVHHCGNQTSYKVFELEFGKKCPCPPAHEAHHPGCCHDEEMVLKANTDEVTVHSFYLANTDFVALPSAPVFRLVQNNLSTTHFTPLTTDSPPGKSGKIFLRHRVLLI